MSNYDDDANRMMDIYDDEDDDDPLRRPIMDEFGNLLDEDESAVVVEEVIGWAADEDDLPAIVGVTIDEDEEIIPGEIGLIEETEEIEEKEE